jgi:branched-chain amino acid transport system ATP-binding protein
VNEGEIVTLIGANGAGKSTLMMTIFGNPRAREGSITYAGRDITRVPDPRDRAHVDRAIAGGPPHLPAHDGVREPPDGRVGERLRPFQRRPGAGLHPVPAPEGAPLQRGGTMSGGEQQMLAIARALMSRPRLLLLDEPSLGLAPLIVKQIFNVIRELNERDGMTVFLVEQNAYHALKLAHRGYVMVTGTITMSGTGKELLADPQVQAAYLEGGRHDGPVPRRPERSGGPGVRSGGG